MQAKLTKDYIPRHSIVTANDGHVAQVILMGPPTNSLLTLMGLSLEGMGINCPRCLKCHCRRSSALNCDGSCMYKTMASALTDVVICQLNVFLCSFLFFKINQS
jgi:hypothetical protein